MIGTMFFVGWVIGMVTLLSLGDILGRKPVVIINIIGMIITGVLIFILHDPTLFFINMCFLGIFTGTKGSLTYLYCMELAHQSFRPTAHNLLNLIK